VRRLSSNERWPRQLRGATDTPRTGSGTPTPWRWAWWRRSGARTRSESQTATIAAVPECAHVARRCAERPTARPGRARARSRVWETGVRAESAAGAVRDPERVGAVEAEEGEQEEVASVFALYLTLCALPLRSPHAHRRRIHARREQTERRDLVRVRSALRPRRNSACAASAPHRDACLPCEQPCTVLRSILHRRTKKTNQEWW